MVSSVGTVTELLQAFQHGDKQAEFRLIDLIYPELRRLARNQMRRERPGHTLQTTALVHETYLRLTVQKDRNWECRAQFLAIAARLMRQILIDHARKKLRQKRGGAIEIEELNEHLARTGLKPAEILELDDCLNRLAQFDARQGQIVEMRFFGGLSVEEVAQHLGVSAKTVKRDWSVARAWLYREMRRSDGKGARAMGENQESV